MRGRIHSLAFLRAAFLSVLFVFGFGSHIADAHADDPVVSGGAPLNTDLGTFYRANIAPRRFMGNIARLVTEPACKGRPTGGRPDPMAFCRHPPHDETGHTWYHPDDVLFDYVKPGGKAALARQGVEFSDGMPGFVEEQQFETFGEEARKVADGLDAGETTPPDRPVPLKSQVAVAASTS